MNNIEDKVLLAAIDEGGRHMPPTFSTIRIAERCHVSEFLIYDHFKTKAFLLQSAHIFLLDKMSKEANAAADKSPTFISFFSELVHYEMAHPSWNGFLLNYGLCFPQSEIAKEDRQASEAFYENNIKVLIPRYWPEEEPKIDRYRFRYFFREVYCFAQLLIIQEIEDTPEVIEKEAKLLVYGLPKK